MAEPQRHDQQERELVTFFLGEEEFGLDIMDVQEIVRLPEMTEIPRAPGYVEGISNLRGNVLPVINTRHRFSMQHAEPTDQTRVVVVDLNGRNVGLVVDAVSEVMRIEAQQIEPPPSIVEQGAVDTRFLTGVVKLDKGQRLVMSLNLNKVCDIDAEPGRGRQVDMASRAQSQTDPRTKVVDEEQLVSFVLSGEEYALNIQAVREIIRPPSLVRTPNAPDYVMGVISLRRKLLPLVDLRRLFGLPPLAEEIAELIETLQLQAQEQEEWLTILEELVEAEEQPLDLPEFKLEGWCRRFQTDMELLNLIIQKIAQNSTELRREAEHLRKLPPAERAGRLRSELLPVANRVSDLFREAVAVLEKNDETRIVVTEANGLSVGLMVDRVREVMRIPNDLIDPPPRLTAQVGPQAERGVAKLDKGQRLVMILDNNSLFDTAELEQLTQEPGEADEPAAEKAEEKLALPKEGNQDLDEEQLVTFRLGREEFGIRIMQIQEINRLGELTKVPRAPFYVDGVTNLRGVVVPVINLRSRFQMEAQEVNDRTRIVIVDMEGKKTALVVDQVSEVIRMLKRDIVPPPSVVSSGGVNDYIEGIGRLDKGKRMLVLLDVSRILQEEERLGIAGNNPTSPRKQLKVALEEDF